MPACSICIHLSQPDIEAAGNRAINGDLSWRAAAAMFDVRSQPLKHHMLTHVLQPEVAAAQAELTNEMDLLIQEAKEGLLEQFRLSPADVKPLILVAIQNLDGLRNTKPSMETLIRALKTVQEMTGMKSQQRLMVDFAKAMYAPRESPALSVSKPEVLQVDNLSQRPALTKAPE